MFIGKRIGLGCVIIASGLLVISCSNEPKSKKDVFLQVNNYSISRDNIQRKMKFEAELDSSFYLTKDTRAEFVKSLIQTQLLVQEAKKEKLDTEEKFRQTIQKYWESTLIRDLLEKKIAYFKQTTTVSEEEVKQFYEDNKEFLPDKPFNELEEELTKKVEEQKVTGKLDDWIKELHKKAQIVINDPELSKHINAAE